MSDADFATIKKLQQERNAAAAAKKGSRTFDPASQRADSSSKAKMSDVFDTELYEREGGDKFAGYHTSLPAGDDDEDMEDAAGADGSRRLVGQYTATRAQIDEFARGNGVEEDAVLAGKGERSNRITDRETDYQKRRFDRVLPPTRAAPFAANRQAGASADEGESCRGVMERRELEEERVRQASEAKMMEGALDGDVVEHLATLKDGNNKENEDAGSTEAVAGRKRKKRRDVATTTTTETTEEAAPQPEA